MGGPNFGRRLGVKIAGNIYKLYEGKRVPLSHSVLGSIYGIALRT